jgi:hypothetical protein
MLAVHDDDLGLTVETVLVIIRVVYEARLVPQTSCINGPLPVQIEQEGYVFPIVSNTPTISLQTGDNLYVLLELGS